MIGLLVKNGMISGTEVGEYGSSTSISTLIGNIFTTAFRVPGHRNHLTIDAYCDDEGLLTTEPDWNVVLEKGTLYGEYQPIAGPIVIIGGDSRTGDSRSLTPEEVERFFIDERIGMHIPVEGGLIAVPTLRFKPWGDK